MSKNYVLAVSGGVDSMVLLDKASRQYSPDRLVVAHFDHGIRPDSSADARFVGAAAKKYGLRFELKREELGKTASEALARDRRYKFLRTVSRSHQAAILTAHHGDDLVETIAINLVRGTGWRGLAVINSPGLIRPLLNLSKSQIYDYAIARKLEWVEDETNLQGAYLRNQLRHRLNSLSEDEKSRLSKLRRDQLSIRSLIEQEVEGLLVENSTSRYFFTMISDSVADELPRQLLVKAVGTPLTRPQRARALVYIKVGKPGSQLELGEGVVVRLSRAEFELQSIKSIRKMLL